MAKVLIFDGDRQEFELEVPKDRFVFLVTESGRVFHMDFSDENMHLANPDLGNLGEKHRELIGSIRDFTKGGQNSKSTD